MGAVSGGCGGLGRWTRVGEEDELRQNGTERGALAKWEWGWEFVLLSALIHVWLRCLSQVCQVSRKGARCFQLMFAEST